MIGRNELNDPNVLPNYTTDQRADLGVQLIRYQIDQLYAAGQSIEDPYKFTPLIYLAGGHQWGASYNPWGQPWWIKKSGSD